MALARAFEAAVRLMSQRRGPGARGDMNGIGYHNGGAPHALEGGYEDGAEGCSDHVIGHCAPLHQPRRK